MKIRSDGWSDEDDWLKLPETTPEDEPAVETNADKLRAFAAGLPALAPTEIYEELEGAGYKGQDAQRRALSLMAYRHVRRLKRLHVENAARRELPPKQNMLLLGPTGSGKTFLVELLFQQIFHLPTVIVDITSYTESGYVGDSVNTILTRLVNAAGGDADIASCGVICLDEFDKIAGSTSNARFAGQGTTKDVSGYGVQRELLKMVDGTEILAPMDYGFSEFGYRAEVSTRDVPFIACGAFTGFEELLKEQGKNIGFRHGKIIADNSLLTIDEVGSFQKYGFLPELIGRFARVVKFPALPSETLKRILTENILPQFQLEFRGEGLDLNVMETALDYLVGQTQKRGTGARGLHTELMTTVEQVAFENFCHKQDVTITVDVKDGQLLVREK